MGCGMFDDYAPDGDPLNEDARWVPISVYTRQDAIDDGVLVLYQFTCKGRRYDVCFTRALHEKYQTAPQLQELVAKTGIRLLGQPRYARAGSEKEDDRYRKLRVIEAKQVWVIEDGDGITYLRPDDY